MSLQLDCAYYIVIYSVQSGAGGWSTLIMGQFALALCDANPSDAFAHWNSVQKTAKHDEEDKSIF